MTRGLLVFLALVPLALSYFSRDFAQFLRDSYGENMLVELERRDLGSSGSFGGKHGQRRVIDHTPILFVHGVTLRASLFIGHHTYFLSHGYDDGQLFASTYGDGGKTPLVQIPIKCEYVKSVRKMVEAVSNYTEKRINMVAYSMGVAVSRKAILGGHCVDTGEDLGPSLTDKIKNYVSIGGVVHGIEPCEQPDDVAKMPWCNKKNSMLCSSQFIEDINKPEQRYEGARTFEALMIILWGKCVVAAVITALNCRMQQKTWCCTNSTTPLSSRRPFTYSVAFCIVPIDSDNCHLFALV